MRMYDKQVRKSPQALSILAPSLCYCLCNFPHYLSNGCLMCGCFGNMCIVFIVFLFFTLFFVFFCVRIFILICFVCTSVRTTATKWQFNCSSTDNKRRSCHIVTFRSSSLPLVSARTSQRRHPVSIGTFEPSGISSTSSRTQQKATFPLWRPLTYRCIGIRVKRLSFYSRNQYRNMLTHFTGSFDYRLLRRSVRWKSHGSMQRDERIRRNC
jgi:hypothetical protein